jgi:hypothetical protein
MYGLFEQRVVQLDIAHKSSTTIIEEFITRLFIALLKTVLETRPATNPGVSSTGHIPVCSTLTSTDGRFCVAETDNIFVNNIHLLSICPISIRLISSKPKPARLWRREYE